MTPEMWKKVTSAWDEYRDLPASERDAFLARLRSEDAAVAREFESLLRQEEASGMSLNQPPASVLAAAEQPPSSGTKEDWQNASTAEPDGPTPKPQAPAESGYHASSLQRAGRYQIEGRIAEGGMGAILRARDPDFDRTLAVKIMLPKALANPTAEARFLKEAKLTGQLQHPGIPPAHDIGRLDNGLPYFAMKLIEGKTLAELLKEKESGKKSRESANKDPDSPLPTSDTRFIAIFGQICQTIGYAHSRNIIHRDLKPLNIMVGAFGEVQVMDWGLAKEIGSQEEGEVAAGDTSQQSRRAHVESISPETVRQTLKKRHDQAENRVLGDPSRRRRRVRRQYGRGAGDLRKSLRPHKPGRVHGRAAGATERGHG